MKAVLFIFLLNFSLVLYAQDNVTKFLGIPVDGSKEEMFKKIEAKGFEKKLLLNGEYCLEGEFNGEKVHVNIQTNNNKVWRIAINDISTRREADIKIRFNELCEQFENNGKYFSTVDDCKIPNEENIEYEMSVNNKRYEAVFVLRPTLDEILNINDQIKKRVEKEYTEEEIENKKEEIERKVKEETNEYLAKEANDRIVWFTIDMFAGEYYIVMFYENRKNQANGEDL